jgi:hypothetical protein
MSEEQELYERYGLKREPDLNNRLMFDPKEYARRRAAEQTGHALAQNDPRFRIETRLAAAAPHPQ